MSEAGWADIEAAFLAAALGETSPADALVRVDLAARREGLADSRRLGRVRALLAAASAQPEERIHEMRNAVFGLIANVDHVTMMLDGASADTPFLERATPEDRGEVLEALRHAGKAAQRLAVLVRGVAP